MLFILDTDSERTFFIVFRPRLYPVLTYNEKEKVNGKYLSNFVPCLYIEEFLKKTQCTLFTILLINWYFIFILQLIFLLRNLVILFGTYLGWTWKIIQHFWCSWLYEDQSRCYILHCTGKGSLGHSSAGTHVIFSSKFKMIIALFFILRFLFCFWLLISSRSIEGQILRMFQGFYRSFLL